MDGAPLYEKSEDLILEFAIKAMKAYEDVRHFDKYYEEVIQNFLREKSES